VIFFSVLLAILAAPAVVLDETQGLDLDVGDGWTKVGTPEGALARWESGDDSVVVARSRGNTDGAYAKDSAARTAYFDGVEQGVRDETAGYRRVGRTERKLGSRKNVPGLDLWFAGKEGVRGMRFVFFRGYMVVAALASPARRRTAAQKKVIESFHPVWGR
jgi:hypothetical protein